MNKACVLLSVSLLLGACSTTTPIAKIGFPSPTVIKGTVHELEDDSFTLKDKTGEIEVELEGNDELIKMLSEGDTFTVKGVLDEDDSEGKMHVIAEEFDAYSVILENGKEVRLIPYDATQ